MATRVRNNSGFLQVLLGCGCLFVIAVIALAAGGAYYFLGGRNSKPSVPAITDSGQVKALAEQILPGFEAPPGHVGFLGQTAASNLLAFVGPAGLAKDSSLQPTQLLFSMLSFPAGQATQEQAEHQLHECLAQQGFALGKPGKLLEQQESALKVAGAEAHVQRRLVDGSPRLLEYVLLLENPQGRTVVLIIDGPLDSFNTAALEPVLAKLQARPLGSPAAFKPATPTPDSATPTPQASSPTPEAATPEALTETPTPAQTGTPHSGAASKKPG